MTNILKSASIIYGKIKSIFNYIKLENIPHIAKILFIITVLQNILLHRAQFYTISIYFSLFLCAVSLLALTLSRTVKYKAKDSFEQRDLTSKSRNIEFILDSIPDIVFLIKRDFKIIECNAIAQQVFQHNLIGKSIYDVLNSEKLVDQINCAFDSNNSKKIEINLTQPLQKSYQILIRLYSIEYTKVDSALIIVKDVTEVKTVAKMLAEFIANASHEMRTPLTSIVGSVESLSETGWQDEEAKRLFIPIIEEQVLAMKNLMNDLLSFSNVERKIYLCPVELIDLYTVIQVTMQMLDQEITKARVNIKLDTKISLPLVLGDSYDLNILMRNILINAIKYGGEGKEILIKTGVTNYIPNSDFFIEEAAVYISIIDQGEGIEQEDISHLTEIFYKTDKSRSKKLGGVGLGLSIAKQIILRHKGTFDIQSIIGEGTNFTIYLPIFIQDDKNN